MINKKWEFRNTRRKMLLVKGKGEISQKRVAGKGLHSRAKVLNKSIEKHEAGKNIEQILYRIIFWEHMFRFSFPSLTRRLLNLNEWIIILGNFVKRFFVWEPFLGFKKNTFTCLYTSSTHKRMQTINNVKIRFRSNKWW